MYFQSPFTSMAEQALLLQARNTDLLADFRKSYKTIVKGFAVCEKREQKNYVSYPNENAGHYLSNRDRAASQQDS